MAQPSGTTEPHDPRSDATSGPPARYAAAMVEGRGDDAERVALDALSDGMSVATLYETVMAPAMAQVGGLWAAGEMTVADEHLASALNLKVMASVYGASLADRPRPSAGRVLLAGVEGDRHGIGVRMAGDVIDLAGFELVYLGEDVSTARLLSSIATAHPDLVAIGVPSLAAAPTAESTVAAVRQAFPDAPILLGGQGVTETIGFVRDVVQVTSLGELTRQIAGAIPADRSGDPPPPVGLALAARQSAARPDASSEDRLLEIAVDSAENARAGARAAEAYRRLAYEDPLTGVANRRAFEERIVNLIEEGKPATLVLIDLDRFKQINDRFGHLAGDRLLVAVASVLESTSDARHFLARIGGDEFALLLEAVSVEAARRRAVELLAKLRLDPIASQVTVTCGVSSLDGDRRQALLAADLALYRGKAAGGDAVEVE